ncbi:hypothetical protein GCM10020254_01840 [Streptomyces goshikiensis]
MINRRTLLAAGAGITATAATVGMASASPRRRRATGAWERLGASLTGDLVLPGDAQYERARQLANAQFDNIYPQAVVYAETPGDVRTAMRFAQDQGIHTAVRSGGHNYGGWSTTEGLVINLTRIKHVRAGADTVSVGPGVQAVDVVPQLSPHGITVPAGFCPTVSPGGFITGGGTGWQYRKYGPRLRPPGLGAGGAGRRPDRHRLQGQPPRPAVGAARWRRRQLRRGHRLPGGPPPRSPGSATTP